MLAQAGVVPARIVPAEIDETPLKGELPRAHAERLAREKALGIRRMLNDDRAFILAADTVVALGRRILPKAMNDDDVRVCLQWMSGRRHTVITAVALALPEARITTRLVETQVALKRLTPWEIASYVRSGDGIGKAGGYGIQGLAETFIRRINGSYSNVVGLPLLETIGLLRAHGFPC